MEPSRPLGPPTTQQYHAHKGRIAAGSAHALLSGLRGWIRGLGDHDERVLSARSDEDLAVTSLHLEERGLLPRTAVVGFPAEARGEQRVPGGLLGVLQRGLDDRPVGRGGDHTHDALAPVQRQESVLDLAARGATAFGPCRRGVVAARCHGSRDRRARAKNSEALRLRAEAHQVLLILLAN